MTAPGFVVGLGTYAALGHRGPGARVGVEPGQRTRRGEQQPDRAALVVDRCEVRDRPKLDREGRGHERRRERRCTFGDARLTAYAHEVSNVLDRVREARLTDPGRKHRGAGLAQISARHAEHLHLQAHAQVPPHAGQPWLSASLEVRA